jgi:hypothetical protein
LWEQKYEYLPVNCGLFVVEVDTVLFTRMVDMTIVPVWLFCRQIRGTGTLQLLDFKHAAPSALS